MLADFFVRPELLWALPIAPAGAIASVWATRRHRRRAVDAFGAGLARSGLAAASATAGAWKTGLLLGLLVLSLAQPRLGWRERVAAPQRVDVVLCLDISRSMRARDVHPDRLERARAEIHELLRRDWEGRVALIAFAGDARVVSPLTVDRSSLRNLLDSVDPADARVGGSNLAVALDLASVALEGAGEEGLVVLLTDGEDLSGEGRRAADRLSAAGARVDCIGLGTRLGARITVQGEEGERFLEDRDGNPVVTRMDRDSLQAIAAVTGGAFVDVGAEEHPLWTRVDAHREHARAVAAEELPRERENRYQWPLALALLLCAASEFRGRKA